MLFNDKTEIELLEKPITVLNYYKKPSLLVPSGISCTWKCEGCINKKHYKDYSMITTTIENVLDQYKKNKIAQSIVFAGLEPFDNIIVLEKFIHYFRKFSSDTIIIYTGYEYLDLFKQLHLADFFQNLMKYNSIIIKFGRYIKNRKPIYNDCLGINLASDNQYTLKINS